MESFELYKVDLSTLPNLNWIKTIACVEILVMDDVIIETYLKNGRLVGGFFYVIDRDKPRDEWDDCQITGFYSSKPED